MLAIKMKYMTDRRINCRIFNKFCINISYLLLFINFVKNSIIPVVQLNKKIFKYLKILNWYYLIMFTAVITIILIDSTILNTENAIMNRNQKL